jgi:mRNA interferase RelE/StbE
MAYTIIFNPAVRRQVRPLPQQLKERLSRRIAALADAPHGASTRVLTAKFQGLRRLRVGDYRVIYHVDEVSQIITIMRVGHRSHVYDEVPRMESDSLE